MLTPTTKIPGSDVRICFTVICIAHEKYVVAMEEKLEYLFKCIVLPCFLNTLLIVKTTPLI
jgi:hypothetical protein